MVYGKKKLTFIFFDFFALKYALKTILKLSVLSDQLSDLKVHLFKKNTNSISGTCLKIQ